MITPREQDLSDLHPALDPYYGDRRVRVRVVTTFYLKNGKPYSRHERTGLVGRTTGHKPAYLIMHRVNQIGSTDLVLPDTDHRKTVVVATKRDGQRDYIPTGVTAP